MQVQHKAREWPVGKTLAEAEVSADELVRLGDEVARRVAELHPLAVVVVVDIDVRLSREAKPLEETPDA
jgi:hypothetical protein